MKNKLMGLVVALLFIFCLAAPVSAYSDYGLCYDATDQVDSTFMTSFNDTLTADENTYNFQLRVDIVDDLEGYDLPGYAELFYNQYAYGHGDNGDGLLLMIYVKANGSDLSFGGYTLYAGGSGKEAFDDSAMAALNQSLDVLLTEENFAGSGDMDNTVIQSALTAFESVGKQFLSYSDINTVPEEVTDPDAVVTDTNDLVSISSGENNCTTSFVTDLEGILSESELSDLENKAKEVSDTYHVGVYAFVCNDYKEYGSDTFDAAQNIYKIYSMGYGDGSEGVLLMLSMSDRDYELVCYGDYANKVFNFDAQDAICEKFLDPFGDNHWHNGFSAYIDGCSKMLSDAENGDFYEKGHGIVFYLIFLIVIPFGAAFAVVMGFKSQMKSARLATDAKDYVSGGGVNITQRDDRFSHVTEVRTKIESNNNSSHHSGGGFSGSGGKF